MIVWLLNMVLFCTEVATSCGASRQERIDFNIYRRMRTGDFR